MEFKHIKWTVRDPYDLQNQEILFPTLSPSAVPQPEPVDPEPSKEPIDPEPKPEFHYYLWSRASAKPKTPPRPVITPPASPIATPPGSPAGSSFTPPCSPPHSPPGSPPPGSPPPSSPAPAASPKGQIIFRSLALKKKPRKEFVTLNV